MKTDADNTRPGHLVVLGDVLSKPPLVMLALGVFVAFMIFAYPAMGALMAEHTPAGAAFDTVFAYSPAEAVRKAGMYDEAGRTAMITLHWTYDLAFPAAYGFLLASLWAVGLRLLANPSREAARSPHYGFLLVALAGPMFDLLENTAVSVLLAVGDTGRHAGGADHVAALASFVASPASALKWVTVTISLSGAILLPMAGISVWAVRRIARRAAGP